MHVPSLILLYAATWFASATALALVAHGTSHQARADLTPEYPQGQDAKSCPLDSTQVDLQLATADSDAIVQLTRVLSTASRLTSSVTQRALTPEELSNVCREVGRFPFAPHLNHDRFLIIATSVVQPGLYVVSVKTDVVVRGLVVGDAVQPQHRLYYLVQNNQLSHVSGQFQIRTPVRLHIVLSFWWPSVPGGGEVVLFKLGPRGYRGPSALRE